MLQEAPTHCQVSDPRKGSGTGTLPQLHRQVRGFHTPATQIRYSFELCRIGRKPSHEFSCSIYGKASRLQFIDVVVSPGPVKQPTEEEDGVGATHPVAAEVNP